MKVEIWRQNKFNKKNKKKIKLKIVKLTKP